MCDKKYFFNDIPEEIDSNQIDLDPYLGQRSPIIKPKLDDTIPSLLNLSSEMSSMHKLNKNDSFNFGSIQFKKDYLKTNSLLSLFQKSNFTKSHYKSFSNEIFTNPKIFNNPEADKKNKNYEEDDSSSYYGGELNFDGVINFWGDHNKEENEDIKKKIIIDNDSDNENQIEHKFENVNVNDEDFKEGFNILNELQKKTKNNN